MPCRGPAMAWRSVFKDLVRTTPRSSSGREEGRMLSREKLVRTSLFSSSGRTGRFPKFFLLDQSQPHIYNPLPHILQPPSSSPQTLKRATLSFSLNSLSFSHIQPKFLPISHPNPIVNPLFSLSILHYTPPNQKFEAFSLSTPKIRISPSLSKITHFPL